MDVDVGFFLVVNSCLAGQFQSSYAGPCFHLQVSRDQSVEGVLSTQSMCDKREWMAVSEAPLSCLDS